MRFLALIFLLLGMTSPHATETSRPVTFDGNGIIITHDGSQTAYNPHTHAGRQALADARQSCCVVAPPDWHGPSRMMDFASDLNRHLTRESARFVVNIRTGAFVSTTTLQDPHYPKTDQRRYVDGDTTPMAALDDDQQKACGCRLGDRVLIENPENHFKVWAVYGTDAGRQEDGLAYTAISPAAANALRIPLDMDTKEPKRIAYNLKLTAYPGSGYGNHFPRQALPPVESAE